MGKVAIIHEALEWTERKLEDIFVKELEQEVKRFDIRKCTNLEVAEFNPDVVLNRVYASVANRNYTILDKTIKLLTDLEKKGYQVINSAKASVADYSKFSAYQSMQAKGIMTPKTIFIDKELSKDDANDLGDYPLIVKRDCGGRGLDLAKVNNWQELQSAIKTIESSEDYQGGIIVQEFVKPIEPQDYRVCVVDGEVVYTHGRTLIPYGEEEPWLASASLGSVNIPLEGNIPSKLADLAIKGARSIDAMLDTLDIVKTSAGYCIIEHNPTPQLKEEWEAQLGYSPTRKFAEAIYRRM